MDRLLDQAEGQAKKQDGLSYTDHEMKFLGGTITEGGSEPPAAMIITFVQAMVAYPKIQERAQSEIDKIVGTNRSPVWNDYDNLPYIIQCVKEVVRWRPVIPLPFPYTLSEDLWVDGEFLMPKDTAIIVNAWGLQYDESRFPCPDEYGPDHFAGITTPTTQLANGPYENRDHYGYGSGRRFCPGAQLAERSMFLAIAKLLWAFKIRPGSVLPDTSVETGYTEGFLSCAKDFQAKFEVR